MKLSKIKRPVKSPNTPQTRTHGFTLVELLVVISIISLLVAILLPSLSAARKAAQSIQCLSNEKQLGLGVVAYTIDHDGKYPAGGPYAGYSGGLHQGTYVIRALAPYVNAKNARGQFSMYYHSYVPGFGNTGFANHQSTTSLLICPSNSRDDADLYWSSYSWNVALCSYPFGTGAGHPYIGAWQRPARVRNPSQVIALGDGERSSNSLSTGYHDYAGQPKLKTSNTNLWYRHANNSINFLWADGHASNTTQPTHEHWDWFYPQN